MVAGTILVQSFSVISLFDSGASRCFISTRLVKMHSIHYDDIDTQWKISTRNGIITTNRVCKSCHLEVCERKLSVDMFVIDTSRYDMILGRPWLSKYHVMIACRSKSMIFRILYLLEFQFFGKSKASRQEQQGNYSTIEAQELYL